MTTNMLLIGFHRAYGCLIETYLILDNMPYHAIVLHLVWPDIDIEFKIDNVDDLDELDNLDELDWPTKD